MRHALNQAALHGHGSVLLVGDLPYYERFGFAAGLLDGVGLPGPVLALHAAMLAFSAR